MINVTKTFLPPQQEYQEILKVAWEKGWLTNRGVLVNELEVKLKKYLKSPNIIATTNGTLPIQIAIKALELKGEVITTPFSYVATTSSIVWEGCTPVFVDIHPDYLTIDETKIEAAISNDTTAILATHVFGNPCHVEMIENIAKENNLKVIYDAAHCFGVTYKNQSIFNFGDVSTCSFHATKLFHTGEGGAMFAQEKKIRDKLFYQHNFGHNGPDVFEGIGINAKMSELQAAMGLAVLPYMPFIIEERKVVVELYNLLLKNLNLRFFKIRDSVNWNYCYYPVIFETESHMFKVKEALEKENIFSRRYFYPSLNTLDYVNSVSMPISEEISRSILCLPLYVGLKRESIIRIVNIIKHNI
jgi:dTDP-4-amino-4,6-dideoxygalactose transaminase